MPPALAGACGATISAAYGGADDKGDAQPTVGGFRVALARGAADLLAARRNAAQLEFASWGETQWPAGLRRLSHLTDVEEAAGAFRLPIAPEGGLPGLTVRAARLRPVPARSDRVPWPRKTNAGAALALGVNRFLGGEQSVVSRARPTGSQHVYVAGQTGTGKSTLAQKHGVGRHRSRARRGRSSIRTAICSRNCSRLIPAHRREDVVVLDPMDKTEFPVGLNLLECRDEDGALFCGARDARHHGAARSATSFKIRHANLMTGPVFYQPYADEPMLLAMSDPDNPGTLLDFYEMFQTARITGSGGCRCAGAMDACATWVKHTLPATKYQHHRQMGTEGIALGEYVSSKFEDFLFDPAPAPDVRPATLDASICARSWTRAKSCSSTSPKASLSEANSRFLGMILMAKIQGAAHEPHQNARIAKRRPFSLLCGRVPGVGHPKFHADAFGIAQVRAWALTLANQFVAQIIDPHIGQVDLSATSGTAHRVSRRAAPMPKLLAPLFQPQLRRRRS